MFNDVAADGQTQAGALGALPGVAGLVEAVKHQLRLGRVHAGTVVLHRDRDAFAVRLHIHHHLAAGVRHLYLDVSHKTTKDFGRQSAVATLVFSIGLTLILGAKLFGLY